MKKTISVIICAIFVGLIFSLYFFLDVKKSVAITKKENVIATAFQVGSYKNRENALKKLEDNPEYIMVLENNSYHVYSAILTNENLINKLNNYYQKLGLNIYLKKIIISEQFLNTLNKYEEILLKTNDINTIIATNKLILKEYKNVN